MILVDKNVYDNVNKADSFTVTCKQCKSNDCCIGVVETLNKDPFKVDLVCLNCGHVESCC